MSKILVVSGSPSTASRTEQLGEVVTDRLVELGWHAEHLAVRTLPAGPLMRAEGKHPEIAEAVGRVAVADGIVLATPTYQASFSGLLKSFLDLLPQSGFAGKTVLPLATGGGTAHVLMLDYALRPVAQALASRHVVRGFFLSDAHMASVRGRWWLSEPGAEGVEGVVREFVEALSVPA
ncbi:NADPH-dependent FMN reductase [Streptomyces venezuelae]|uniref:NADPH-dependent FMN reductase n=1 Tax=Streptomyces venezuelae TaxID=54571 RepID=UPI0033184A07